MRAVMLEGPQALVDEMGDGELHREPGVIEAPGGRAEAVDGVLRPTWEGGPAGI